MVITSLTSVLFYNADAEYVCDRDKVRQTEQYETHPTARLEGYQGGKLRLSCPGTTPRAQAAHRRSHHQCLA